jgi:hypothetical protein
VTPRIHPLCPRRPGTGAAERNQTHTPVVGPLPRPNRYPLWGRPCVPPAPRLVKEALHRSGTKRSRTARTPENSVSSASFGPLRVPTSATATKETTTPTGRGSATFLPRQTVYRPCSGRPWSVMVGGAEPCVATTESRRPGDA